MSISAGLAIHQIILLCVFLGTFVLWLCVSHFREEWRDRKWLITFWSMVMCGMIICIDGEFAISTAAIVIYCGTYLQCSIFTAGDKLFKLANRIKEIHTEDATIELGDAPEAKPEEPYTGKERRSKPRGPNEHRSTH